MIKSIIIAFSMYSKIPMPQFPWEDKDMRYVMCFFPGVGIVIGAATMLWGLVCKQFEVGNLCYAMIGTVIPIVISGGIHLDGYLDTMDALNSYQSRERKLEILKDSHIGAFAAISLFVYGCVYAGAYGQTQGSDTLLLVAMGFVLSRILSGIGVVSFRCAKHEGLLFLFSSKAEEKRVRWILIGELAVCAGVMVMVGRWKGVLELLAAGLTFFYYKKKCDKEFGGITGDTAGFFVSVCECGMVVVAAILQ
ncbi:MAG: adenosylcobinamide-GDP ribazoletransferase [Lachnospiraceae bacterium]